MCVQSCSGKTVVYVNTFTWLNIKPSTKDKGHISVNKHSVTKALHFMNIKWDTLNPTSLVLGGPSLHSYCLLWFIRRCMCLFDVLRGFAPVRWEKKALRTRGGFARQSKWQQEKEDLCCLDTFHVCLRVCLYVCAAGLFWDTVVCTVKFPFVKQNPPFSSCWYWHLIWCCEVAHLAFYLLPIH